VTPGAASPWSAALALLGFVGLCELVGIAAGAVTVASVRTWYLTLAAPPGTPPSWVFGPVWTTLYAMLGIAAWLVWRRPGHRRALLTWGWHLLVNALWAPAFFGLRSTGLGLLVILALLVAIGMTMRQFRKFSGVAVALMVPYLAWTCYATYLNAGFFWLNVAR